MSTSSGSATSESVASGPATGGSTAGGSAAPKAVRRNLTPEAIQQQQVESLRRACVCAQLAEDLKGQNTIVLDLTAVTPIVDYFVISSGTSSRQMRAIADGIRKQLREQGTQATSVEGEDSGTWILHDYGDIVIHIFTGETRLLYDLENLWADARSVDWKAELPPRGTPST